MARIHFESGDLARAIEWSWKAHRLSTGPSREAYRVTLEAYASRLREEIEASAVAGEPLRTDEKCDLYRRWFADPGICGRPATP